MVGADRGLEVDEADELKVGPPGLLVDRALVEPGVAARGRIDCVDVQDRQGDVQHLRTVTTSERYK